MRLYVSVFVTSLGAGMYTYFIPVFAQSLGASFLDLGIIGGAYSITYAVSPMIAGYLADKVNRAWLFSLGIMTVVLATITLMLSHTVQDIMIVRAFAGFAFAFFWPISEALVIDLAPLEKRVKEMGLYSVSWGSGFLIGPMLGGLVIQTHGFIWLFASSALLISFSLLFTVVWIVPTQRNRTTRTTSDFSSTLPIMAGLLPAYMMTLCYGIVSGIIMTIFPGYANSVGVDPVLIGLLFTAFTSARILAFSVSERLLSLGESRILHAASGVLVMGGLSIAVFANFRSFLPTMIVVGGCFGAIFPLAISFISRHFPNEKLGAAAGSYEAVFGIGSAVGPILAGVVAQLANIHWAFTLVSVFAALMFVFVTLWERGSHFEPRE